MVELDLEHHLEQTILLLSNIKEIEIGLSSIPMSDISISNSDQLYQDIFHQFFRLGCVANEQKFESFKNSNNSKINSLVQNIVQLIWEHDKWLYFSVSDYPPEYLQTDEPELIDNRQFEVRSGVQFMFNLFHGIDENLDIFLEDFKLNIFPEFDIRIQIVKGYGIKHQFSDDEWTSKIPKHHTWWFF